VDDPFTFGQIAVANSLSDVYAMGGKPLTAMNVVCFPIQTMDISILKEILLGGIEKMREAEVVLLGGHSVDDPELKYGLSVTGIINPARVLRKEGAQLGDKLILTKPLGTGIISTAIKGKMASEKAIARYKIDGNLNRKAWETMLEVETCLYRYYRVRLDRTCGRNDRRNWEEFGHSCCFVPVFPDAQELAESGMVPGGLYRNRDYRKHMVEIEPDVSEFLADILFDPQTSGGLLISVPAERRLCY
jgi:selenide,water dikinase